MAGVPQDFLRFMAELESGDDVMAGLGQTGVRGRSLTVGGGAGSRTGSRSASVSGSQQVSPAYLGQQDASIEAKDPGTLAPSAAEKYLAYKQDPEWQHWNKMRGDAVNSLKSGGGFWNWATGGRHGAAVNSEIANADYMARQVEQRYLNEASLWASNQEQFTGEVKNEINPETNSWDRVTYGSHGTRRVLGAAPQEMEQGLDQFGRPYNRVKRPMGTAMVVDPKYAGLKEDTSTPRESDPLVPEDLANEMKLAAARQNGIDLTSGQAEVGPGMTQLVDSKYTKEQLAIKNLEAGIAKENALAGKYNAEAAMANTVNMSAGGQFGVYDSNTGQYVVKGRAPFNPNTGSGSGGANALTPDMRLKLAKGKLVASLTGKVISDGKDGFILIDPDYASKKADSILGMSPELAGADFDANALVAANGVVDPSAVDPGKIRQAPMPPPPQPAQGNVNSAQPPQGGQATPRPTKRYNPVTQKFEPIQ